MKNRTRILDSISAYLFLLGNITYRLRAMPFAIVSAIFNLVSLFAYLAGYIVWHVAALFYPGYPRHDQHWYGFAEFKEQYQIAALLGAVATIICLVFPPMVIPAALLYTLSNLIWTISEHHKKQNPPPDDSQYSSIKQAIYFKYSVLVTAGSALTAIASTVVFLFPPASFVVLTASTMIGLGLTVAALYYWGKSTFGHFQPDKVDHSYKKFSKQLSFELDHYPKPDATFTHTQEKKQRGVFTTNKEFIDEVLYQENPIEAPHLTS